MTTFEIRQTSRTKSSLLESSSDAFARRLAQRVSRRSFLGRVGKGAIVAATAGVAGVALLDVGAFAHVNPCQETCSISCESLPGHNANSCPGSTNTCGCWCINVSSVCGATGIREWCDCCGDNYCQGNRQCVEGTDNRTHPSCYNHDAYGPGSEHIACRRHHCVTQSQCARFDMPC